MKTFNKRTSSTNKKNNQLILNDMLKFNGQNILNYCIAKDNNGYFIAYNTKY
jgi:hypothetical protein